MNYIFNDSSSKNPQNKVALYVDNEKSHLTTISYDQLSTYLDNIQRSIETISRQTSHSIIVAICLPQSIENLILCLTVFSKYTCVPLNPDQTTDTLKQILDDLSPTLLITDELHCKRFEEKAKKIGISLAIAGSLDRQRISIPLSLIYDSNRMMNDSSNVKYCNYSLILTTSGSTGQPKQVGLTWQQLTQSASSINKTLALGPDDTVLHALPMFHIGAFVDLLLVPLLSGGSIYVKKVSETAHIVDTLHQNHDDINITWYQCVPTMLHDLLRYADDRLIGRLKFIRIVSAPIANDMIDNFYEQFQIPIIPMYGMTEAAGQITSWSLDPSKQRAHSVGKITNVPTLIFDDNNIVKAPNQSGHICISGTQVIDAYLSGTTPLQSHIKRDGTFWLKTGDIGYVDSEGYLFITSREKEIVNRGGEKISLQMIDLTMSSHRLIKECAACAIPHKTLGEEVALAIVPIIEPTLINKTALIQDIKSFALKNLATYSLPKFFHVVEALPKTSSGKIKRHDVTQLLLESLQTDTISSTKEAVTISREKQSNNQESWKAPVNNPNAILTDTTTAAPIALINEICVLWQSVLDTETVHPEDNFFLLGGDSLLAATFIEELLSRYPNLSTDWLINLYDFPTAGEFANELSTVITKTPHPNKHLSNTKSFAVEKKALITSDIVLEPKVLKGLRSFLSAWSGSYIDANGLIFAKNTSGDKPPFFWCVQSYDEFNNVAKALPRDIPIYGMRTLFQIQQPSKRDNDTLAKYYASIIMVINNDRPYYLGGFCEGGTVMYLIAQQLKQSGKLVELLAIQDKVINSTEPVAKKIALFWTQNEPNDRLTTYMEELPNVLDEPLKNSFFASQRSFFFPKYKWFTKNNVQDVSIYYYPCQHIDINASFTDHFVNDLCYEIEQVTHGKPSKNQIQHVSHFTPPCPEDLSYRIVANIPYMIAQKNERHVISVTIENICDQTIHPTSDSGITLTAKWLNHKGDFRQLAGVSIIRQSILGHTKITVDLEIVIPEKSGMKLYQLNIGLVQEGLYWLADKGLNDITKRIILS